MQIEKISPPRTRHENDTTYTKTTKHPHKDSMGPLQWDALFTSSNFPEIKDVSIWTLKPILPQSR